jgi:hypothetical protein
MPATAKIGILLTALLALAGCGSEREHVVIVDCPGPNLGLDGTWFGAMEDDNGDLFTLEWNVCGDRITSEFVSDFNSGVNGQLWQTGPGAWRGQLSDGTEFHLLTDAGRYHAVMVNEYFEFAVLEREALGLPSYFFSDLDGAWSGRHVRLGWNSSELRDAWLLMRRGCVRQRRFRRDVCDAVVRRAGSGLWPLRRRVRGLAGPGRDRRRVDELGPAVPRHLYLPVGVPGAGGLYFWGVGI